MRDKVKMMLGISLGVMTIAAMVYGTEYRPAPEQTKAALGATHVIRLKYSDLTETNASTAQTLTVMTVQTNQALEGVMAVLKTAFYGGSTNISSTKVQLGEASSEGKYLNEMEVNSNGTEEFLKFGTGYSSNKVYTSSTPLILTVTPTGIDGLDDLTQGELLIYIKSIDQKTFAK